MPEGKYFRIRSRMHGMVLDISGAQCRPGQKVIMFSAKNDGYDNQLWRSDPMTKSIRSKLNENFCMDLDGQGTLIVNPYNGNDSQKWKLAGDRIIRHSNRNMALDIAQRNNKEHARVIVYPFNGNDNQRWEIQCESPEYFFIRSDMHGKVLDVHQYCRDEGARIVCWDQKVTADDNQLWYEDRYGYLRSKLSNMLLDASGREICLRSYESDNDRQKWVLAANGTIVNEERQDEVLDIKAKNRSNGAVIIPYKAHGADNQKWKKLYV